MQILQELEALIPPLTTEEYKQLERNILEEGIRDPLVTWNGILVDGHNRYRIAQEFDINYKTIEKQFTDINAVKEWMINNQFGRRNLNNYQRSVLALQLEEVFKAKAKEKEFERKTTFLKSEKSNLETVNSIKEIAKIANVGHDTIAKVKKIEAVATPSVKEMINTGKISINEAYNVIKKEPMFAISTPEELLKKAKEVARERAEVKRQIIDQKGSTEVIPKEDIDLIERLKKGETVVLNMNTNFHAMKWAKDNNRFQQIDRWSDWGNPFVLNSDGDRDKVCESFKIYFDLKLGLKAKVKELKGKALGCHCYPLRCHGEHLKQLADEN